MKGSLNEIFWALRSFTFPDSHEVNQYSRYCDYDYSSYDVDFQRYNLRRLDCHSLCDAFCRFGDEVAWPTGFDLVGSGLRGRPRVGVLAVLICLHGGEVVPGF